MNKDKNLFIEHVTRNRDIINKICNVYCRGECDREDLAQEIVYQLWKSYGGFRNESAFSTWMYKVALNTAFQYLRHEYRKPETNWNNQAQAYLEDDSPGQSTDLSALLYRLISQLQPFDRALLMLWLEKKSYTEISGILGISDKNVSVKIVRIKENLKKLAASVEFEF
jgi:RNA polymerase sigma-70 factor (ECF subfamily)